MSSHEPPPISAAELAALPPQFQAILRRVMQHYEAIIAKLEARIESLEAEQTDVRKTPQNSSLPPS